MDIEEILTKLKKYVSLFVSAFEKNVALSGKEEILPEIVTVFPDYIIKAEEDVHYLFLPVAVRVAKDEVRQGIIAFEISEKRLRIETIPFEPERVKSVLESDKAKEFLLTVLQASHEVYDVDYAIYKSKDGKRILLVENDMLTNFITYDEFEEEFYGVIIGVVELYKRLKEKSFEPKLHNRKVEKIEEEIDRLPFFT